MRRLRCGARVDQGGGCRREVMMSPPLPRDVSAETTALSLSSALAWCMQFRGWRWRGPGMQHLGPQWRRGKWVALMMTPNCIGQHAQTLSCSQRVLVLTAALCARRKPLNSSGCRLDTSLQKTKGALLGCTRGHRQRRQPVHATAACKAGTCKARAREIGSLDGLTSVLRACMQTWPAQSEAPAGGPGGRAPGAAGPAAATPGHGAAVGGGA